MVNLKETSEHRRGYLSADEHTLIYMGLGVYLDNYIES